MAHLWPTIVLGLTLFGMPGAARAQMISPMLSEGPRIALQGHADRFAREESEPRLPQPPVIDPAVLRYTPSKVRRSANLANFVQKTRTADPQAAADLQKLFAQGDIIEKIGRRVAPQGLRIDDVADAYALWWITAWQAAQGKGDTPDRTTLAAVRRQAAEAVTAAGTIARAADAQKQALAESLWVQATLIETGVQQARNDPARLRAIGQSMRQGARSMGLDLDHIALTSDGFVLRRRDPRP
ncbi:DUF6683 family protein [Sphingomonas sp.]|uniref:DUF6683 family protein n=1 Tax=Sphingomonas sp. TaxID=28214 RepID=UPI0028AFB25F|nr:DUF6683 family protein [Sphingomonas sp.]